MRREEPLGAHAPEPIVSRADGIDPEHEALLAEAVGLALLVVLETLAPAERVAFVLHDMFDVPFDEIAPIVGRSPAAARQLASRARRRVQGAATVPDADLTRQRELVNAFLAASRGGDFDALLALLDPDVVLRADRAAVRAGASSEVRGATAVAKTFSGRARAAQPALVNGAAGLVWAPGGRPRVAFGFTIRRGKIAEIDLVADPERTSPARSKDPQRLNAHETRYFRRSYVTMFSHSDASDRATTATTGSVSLRLIDHLVRNPRLDEDEVAGFVVDRAGTVGTVFVADLPLQNIEHDFEADVNVGVGYAAGIAITSAVLTERVTASRAGAIARA